jgi:hypothetical protein
MAAEIISQEYLKYLFDYKDGELYWKVKFTDKVNIGSLVGHMKHGRRYTKINKKDYLVHRLIYLYHHGYLPKCVDHMDCDMSNNRIENLREATRSQNNYNSRLSKANTSGAKGVTWKKERNKWKVEFYIDKKLCFFGSYSDFEEAKSVAIAKRNEHHKEFARHE